MNFSFDKIIYDFLILLGLSESSAKIIETLTILLVVIFLAFLVDFIFRKVLISILTRLIKKTKSKWDDIFVERKILKRVAHLAPAIVFYYYAKLGLTEYPILAGLLQSLVYIYLIIMTLLILDRILTAINDIYETLPASRNQPIKGYIQSIKIVFYFFGIIFIISIIIGKSPTKLIAGLGAMAAILILVFKDTILGFVSSIQLSANKMLKPGDWITMPGRSADGVVQEITLNTVKVQNFDKTISTIPTYALISESFQNWKGMEEAKGRRIARSFYIDMRTIKFCDREMIEKFKKIKIISEYVASKQLEIESFNKAKGIDHDKASRRNLTNVGVFRKYIEFYLNNHPQVHPSKPPYLILVRHLHPQEKGLPIQIYCFSKETAWVKYEQVQADIFDHVLAVASEFELDIFQNPSGSDFRNIGKTE